MPPTVRNNDFACTPFEELNRSDRHPGRQMSSQMDVRELNMSLLQADCSE